MNKFDIDDPYLINCKRMLGSGTLGEVYEG